MGSHFRSFPYHIMFCSSYIGSTTHASSGFLTLSPLIRFPRHLYSFLLITVKCEAPRTTKCTGREQQTTLCLSILLLISPILLTFLLLFLLYLRRMWVLSSLFPLCFWVTEVLTHNFVTHLHSRTLEYQHRTYVNLTL